MLLSTDAHGTRSRARDLADDVALRRRSPGRQGPAPTEKWRPSARKPPAALVVGLPAVAGRAARRRPRPGRIAERLETRHSRDPLTATPEITSSSSTWTGVLIDARRPFTTHLTPPGPGRTGSTARVLAIIHGRRTVGSRRSLTWTRRQAESGPDREAIAERARAERRDRTGLRALPLPDRGRVAVATSARLETALTNLRVLGLEHPEFCFQRDVESGKPPRTPARCRAAGRRAGRMRRGRGPPAGIKAGKAARHLRGRIDHHPRRLTWAGKPTG